MTQPTSSKNKEDQFENKTTKKLFQKGVKFLALALPLLFISPIVITIGFKAISKGDSYLVLVLGCMLAVVTIVVVTQAFRLILKSLFNK